MLAALLLTTGSLAFPGGTPDALAEAYFDQLGEPVAVVAVDKELPAFDVTGETALVRNARIAARRTLRRADDRTNSLSFDAWPQGASADPSLGGFYLSQFPLLPASAVRIEEGRVTVVPEKDKYVSLGMLRELRWSRPVRVHWILRRVPIAVRAEDMPEQRFLRLVAAAVGGRVTTSRTLYDVRPDMTAYRDTLIAAKVADHRPMVDRWDDARRRMYTGLLRAVPLATLQESIAHPQAIVAFEAVPGTPVGVAARRFFDDLSHIAETLQPGESFPPGFLNLVDMTKPIRVRFGADGQVMVLFPGKKPGQAIAP